MPARPLPPANAPDTVARPARPRSTRVRTTTGTVEVAASPPPGDLLDSTSAPAPSPGLAGRWASTVTVRDWCGPSTNSAGTATPPDPLPKLVVVSCTVPEKPTALAAVNSTAVHCPATGAGTSTKAEVARALRDAVAGVGAVRLEQHDAHHGAREGTTPGQEMDAATLLAPAAR